MKYITTRRFFLTGLLGIFILLFQVLWNDYLVRYLSLIYRFGTGVSLLPLRDTLNAFGDFQKRNKGVWSNAFWKCVHDTIHWDNRHIQKIPFGQSKKYKKMFSFFFREFQLIAVLLLICDSYMNWSIIFVPLKLRVGFSIFDSVSFLLKFIFFSTKYMISLTLKCHNSFQN